MDSTKYVVGVNIPVPPVPPALNDAGVVAVDDNMAICLREKIEGVDEELEANRFGPSNVALGAPHGFPIWVESPGPPSLTDDDCNAHARAGIGES